MTRSPALLAAATALALAAGCSAAPSTEGGFVSGDGSVSLVAVADRREPGEVAGRTLDGREVALEDLRGRVVVMPVWGSWCGPCRKEAPMLASVSEQLRGEGVAFLGLNVRDPSKAQAQAFVRNTGIGYPSIYDPSGETMLAFRDSLPPQAIPSTLVLDERGRVAARVLGQISRSTLLGVVDEVREGEA